MLDPHHFGASIGNIIPPSLGRTVSVKIQGKITCTFILYDVMRIISWFSSWDKGCSALSMHTEGYRKDCE